MDRQQTAKNLKWAAPRCGLALKINGKAICAMNMVFLVCGGLWMLV